MQINNNIISFRSLPEYYDKEYYGKKSNTVRIVSEEGDAYIQTSELDYIKIKNIDTGDIFYRLLTDVTRFVYKDLIIYIFSWKHDS